MPDSHWNDTDTLEPEAPCALHGDDDTPTTDPQLINELRELLGSLETEGPVVDARLEDLQRRFGNEAYSELIFMLSHLRFPPEEAGEHWVRIQRHRTGMQRSLGLAVDVRLALLSYFLEVNRKLQNPKIIEMQLFERTHESAHRDGLTGLYNYRAFREHLAREIFRSERSGAPMSLVMLDVDDFKAYNDTKGHDAGNAALVRIGQLLTGSLRKFDIAARYGGEEFALILTSTPKAVARQVAERVREVVARQRFGDQALTVSLGIATYPADSRSDDQLIRKADRAMYVSKSAGKNRCTLYGQSARSHGRIDAQLTGEFRAIAGDPLSLTSLNLSESGMLFEASRRMPIESLVEIRLDLDGTHILLSARIVHVSEADERYFTAVRFIEASSVDRLLLGRYIRDRQVAADPA